MSESDVIEMHEVTVAYNSEPVLDSVNFTLGVGEFC